VPPPPWRTDLLRGATWRAARHGLTGRLLDPRTKRPDDAAQVVGCLLAHVEPALRDAGDLELVRAQAATVLRRGTGAARQREVYARTGSLAEVVADAVAETAR
jgi:carboxylate-amine ligase